VACLAWISILTAAVATIVLTAPVAAAIATTVWTAPVVAATDEPATDLTVPLQLAFSEPCFALPAAAGACFASPAFAEAQISLPAAAEAQFVAVATCAVR